MDCKKTFLFIRKLMDIGGIETYIYRTVKQLKLDGHRIIWLFPEGGYIDESFKKELMDDSVEIIRVNFDKILWISKLNISFNSKEEVCALAFSLFDFTFLEMIKNKYKDIYIDSFFWIPHFYGKAIFIEKFAPGILQPILRKYISKIIYSMEQNRNIIYVNKSHLDAFTRTYGYKVENESERLLTGSAKKVYPYNYDLALKRSERKEFNIITVSRFTFPHKAYLIGLIKTYAELKEKYDQLKLTIIGYGREQDKVLNEIEKLSAKAKKDLILAGKVAYDDLHKYFEKSHMNIGVASTISDGALTGLISIPVRHYTENCEGYGYLPESKKFTTSSEPGEPIKTFIEEVINMDKKTYLELSKKSYSTYAIEKDENSTNHLLKMENKDAKNTLRKSYIVSIFLSYKLFKILRTIRYKWAIFMNSKSANVNSEDYR